MAKSSFENSAYYKMYADSVEGRQILTQILADPNLVRSNFGIWRRWFTVDPQLTPTNPDGTAAFRVSLVKPAKSNVMHWRAPLGDTVEAEKEYGENFTGGIVDFIADGYRENAMEREDREARAAEFGSDSRLIFDWATNVAQKFIEARDQSLSHMGAYAMSHGFLNYLVGEGIHGNVYSAPIPAENKITAGEKAWNDPTCPLLDQMVKIEQDFRDKWGIDIALQWDIPYDIWKNVFLKNAQVINWVKQNMYQNGRPVFDNMIVLPRDVEKFIRDYEGLSPINVVSEKQYDRETIVSGWKTGIAVLRPAGYAGMVMHTENLDKRLYTKYGNNTITRVFATDADGLLTFMNTTLNNGNMKEWHSDAMMQAVPVLTDWLYHVLVDTTTADA